MLYAVKTAENSCDIKIYYDNNKLKGQVYDVTLETNSFIMFPENF